MPAFGPRISGRQAIESALLEKQGLEIYIAERKGEMFLQIRQTKPKKWRLKSLVVGRLGGADIVYELGQ
jgi:hypothetical protein